VGCERPISPLLARSGQSSDASAAKMRRSKVGCALMLGSLLLLASRDASAQVTGASVPNRDKTWQTVTGITMVAGGATELLMPRIFYADPEVTVGWKARWHVSVLAPVMTLTALTLLNEYALKDALQEQRPDCDTANPGTPLNDPQGQAAQNTAKIVAACNTNGGPSTHAFGGTAAFGHGLALFIFDTTKWSDGRINGGALAGHVIAPFILAGITAVGRGAGNWESTGQILEGAGLGLVFGFLTGMTYSLMARPECGYTGSLICW
jgi:hypothetical protein